MIPQTEGRSEASLLYALVKLAWNAGFVYSSASTLCVSTSGWVSLSTCSMAAAARKWPAPALADRISTFFRWLLMACPPVRDCARLPTRRILPGISEKRKNLAESRFS